MAKLRKLIGFLAAGVGLIAATFMATSRRPKKTPKTDLEATSAFDPNTPNILLFVLDDLDTDTLKRMLDANQLPNIKSKIVDGAVNFSNAYVPTSICSPSRASLLTGRLTHNHGVWHVVGTEGPEQFDNYLNSTGDAYLPKWLSTSHYRAFVGKYHLGSRHPEWDYFRPVEGYDPRPGMYRATENDAFVWPNVYQTKYIGDSAKQAIALSGDRPFFVLVAPTPIHVNISSWHQRSNQAQANYTGTPVAFAQFPKDPAVGWRQHLVTADFHRARRSISGGRETAGSATQAGAIGRDRATLRLSRRTPAAARLSAGTFCCLRPTSADNNWCGRQAPTSSSTPAT